MQEIKTFKQREKPETEQDVAGLPISPERLAELYPGRENLLFWSFVRQLRQQNWKKFCVSKGRFFFSRDFEIRFFQIGEVTEKEAPEIIFFGQGKALGTTEIYCQYAAKTWGFAVLNLREESE